MIALPRLNVYHAAAAVLLTVLCFLVARIFGASGMGRIAALNEQLAAQRLEADTMLQRNQLMAKQIELIKSDELQVEVLARYHFGMVKPGEVFIQDGSASRSESGKL